MAYITLTNSKKIVLIDEEDYKRASTYKWYLSDTGYVMHSFQIKGTGRHINVRLHIFIAGQSIDKKVIDHIDGNPLNNQKSNLRFVSHSENQLNRHKQSNNTSSSRGVCYHKTHKLWLARGWTNKKQFYLGWFKKKKAAIQARKNFEKSSGYVHGHTD